VLPIQGEGQHVPLKHWCPTTSLHGVTTQKTANSIFTAAKNTIS